MRAQAFQSSPSIERKISELPMAAIQGGSRATREFKGASPGGRNSVQVPAESRLRNSLDPATATMAPAPQEGATRPVSANPLAGAARCAHVFPALTERRTDPGVAAYNRPAELGSATTVCGGSSNTRKSGVILAQSSEPLASRKTAPSVES